MPLLTTLLVAGGLVYVSAKTSPQEKTQKKYISTPSASSKRSPPKNSFGDIIEDAITRGTIILNQSFRIGKSKFKRGQGISPDKPKKPSNAEEQQVADYTFTSEEMIDRNIVISAASLGVASLAVVIYPPLGILSVPAVLYACQPLLQKTYRKMKERKVGVDTLVTLTFVGCLLGGYYFMTSLVLFIFSISEKLLVLITEDSHHKLIDVFQQVPKTVWVLVDGVELQIPFPELNVGDVVVAYTGEVIPADGVVTFGMASVDQHILTGEAKPVDKGIGDEVFASTTVLAGQIHIRVEKAGSETTVAKIGQVLNNTLDFKTSTELRAEMLGDKSVLPTLLLAGIALPTMGTSGSLGVLNSHFSNKMRLISQLSVLNYLKLASENNILIKDGRSLELLRKVDTIVFDKTGTLTEEQPTVGTVHCYEDYREEDILSYAAAAEYKQTHPIAKAIVLAAKQRNLALPTIYETEYKVGYGLTIRIKQKIIRVGSARFMEIVEIPIPQPIKDVEVGCHQQGYSLIMVAIDEQVVGAIELQPTIRPEMAAVIRKLRQRSQIKNIYIISGDHEVPTRRLAEQLGIDHYFAETLPEHKAEIIEKLQAEGKFICYVGDGINDSIALKKSQVSVSLQGASTVATDTAQIVLLDQGLKQLNYLFELAHSFNQNMDTTIALVVTPTLIGISGVFLFGFGLPQSVVLNLLALIMGTGNAMLPLLTNRESSKLSLPTPSKKAITQS